MTYLLDTTVLVDDLRRRPAAAQFLEGLNQQPSVSVVSALELYAGARSAVEETHIERILAGNIVLPVTTPVARLAGQFIKHLGNAYGFDEIDAIIAATAEHHGLDLATLNVKHFPMFRRLKRAY